MNRLLCVGIAVVLGCGPTAKPPNAPIASDWEDQGPSMDLCPKEGFVAKDWTSMTTAERFILEAQLQTWLAPLTGDAYEVSPSDAGGVEIAVPVSASPRAAVLDVESAESCLAAYGVTGYRVTRYVQRGPASIRALNASQLKKEFVGSGSRIDLDRLWTTVLNGIPSACNVQLDASSLVVQRLTRTVRSQERQLPRDPRRRGIRVKDVYTFTLKDGRAVSEGMVEGTYVFINLEVALYWRPESSRRWNKSAFRRSLKHGPTLGTADACSDALLALMVN